MTQLGRF